MEKFEVESYVKAGKIAAETVKYAKSFIKKDMLLVEIANKIENKIKELGGSCAFPVNLSINEIAAHYTPSLNDKTKASGLLSIDLGIELNGFIADTAFSLDLEGNFKQIIELNENALNFALENLKKNKKVSVIGNSIHEFVEKYNKENNTNFSIIKNLTGHALGENLIHAGINIPNYKNYNNNELKDIAIAIEPFLTQGIGEVYESSVSEIYMLQSQASIRDNDARKILSFIKENYKTKPFCKRWLEKKGFAKVNFSLSQLTKQGILHNFPVLIEKSRMPVSQAEHTVLINKDMIVTTK